MLMFFWSVYEIGNPTVTNNQKPSGISVNDSGSVITIDGSQVQLI
ncbi:MAG: hypothetical protein CM15mP83_3610 [Flavobacteriaceae bacterium]|nr:MAG: hypothetical protein CM15mP83_3610 [Flavobacteriaceae bacterium]